MLDTLPHTMHHPHHRHHQQAALHDSTFFFVGPFDDNSFCRGPQVLKPISTHFSKHSSLAASPISESDDDDNSDYETTMMMEDDCAVLGDDEEHSEDELPPSPRRRHSGAMSISSEDLPFCYDRDALRRDTAAHRARHQEQMKALKSRGRMGTFAAHETWDCELDGPHMALWVPKSKSSNSNNSNSKASSTSTQESKRRRLEKSTGSNKQAEAPRQVEEIDGPMMSLWGI